MSKQFENYKAANEDRVAMIAKAISQVSKDGLEVLAEHIAAKLPGDFALDMNADFVSEIAAGESGVVTGDIGTKEGGDGASLADLELIETPDEMRARVVTLDRKAADLRGKIFGLRNRLGTARGALADAISSFVSGHGPKITQQQNVRAELAASLATRASQARGDDLPPAVSAGPSNLDRAALYSGSASGTHNADDFLRKQMRTGFRRGSAPASNKGAATRLRVPQA